MKRIVIFLLIVTMSWSCKNEPDELFQMEIQTEFTIDASLNTILTHYFPIVSVPTNFSLFSGNIDSENIGAIRSRSCTMSSIFAPIDYDFIQEISIDAIDPSNPQLRQELFFLDPNQLGSGTELQLFSTLSDHKELLVNDLVNLEIRIELRYNAPITFDNRLVLTFQAFDTE